MFWFDLDVQGRTQGGDLGLNPPLSLIFYKTLLPSQGD